jgi:hypothetical protein
MLMRLRHLPLAAACALAVAAPASADSTTILVPPAKAPVTIPGSQVERGDALTDGQELMRRTVDVRAGRPRRVTLRCPDGTRHAGLGVFDDARVGFAVVGARSYIGHRTLRLRAFAAPKTPRGRLVRASIFALCEPPSRAR